MKKTSLIILLAAMVVPFFATGEATARDSEKITYRSSKTARVASKFFARPRRQLAPAKRIFLNTNVYRHQGVATVRHDEVSSPEIIFHIRNGRLRPGHAYDR